MRIASVQEVTELDRNNPRHPLCKTLSVARRFEGILLDGHNPDRVSATATLSLFEHVAEHAPGKSKYTIAKSNFKHPFWDLLRARNSRTVKDSDEIQKLLRRQGRVRLDTSDLSNGITLGLLDESYASIAWQLEDRREIPYAINYDSENPSLDELQLLLLLYREAQDLAQNWQAEALGSHLSNAANCFAAANLYSGEQLDTWHLLVQTRMLRWDPDFSANEQAISLAHEQLLEERDSTPKRKSKRGPARPDSYTHGRAERRWRRQVWARACRLRLEALHQNQSSLSDLDYHYVKSEIGDWLIENRWLINEYDSRAVDFLMDSDGATTFNEFIRNQTALPPLTMPESLYRLRKRPFPDDQMRHHFGDFVPYDVIPVHPIDE